MHPGQGEAQQQQSWRLTMKPDSHPEHRQKATTVSWYSSGVACFASTLTATGSTVRAATTATRSPDPNDTATLCNPPQGLVNHLLKQRHILSCRGSMHDREQGRLGCRPGMSLLAQVRGGPQMSLKMIRSIVSLQAGAVT